MVSIKIIDYLIIVFKKDGTVIHKSIKSKKFNNASAMFREWFYATLYDKIMNAQDYRDIDIIIFVDPTDVFGTGFIFDTKLEKAEIDRGKALRFNSKRRSGFVMHKSVADIIPSKYLSAFMGILSDLGYEID